MIDENGRKESDYMAGRSCYLSKEAKEDGVYLVDGWLAIPCEICGGTLFKTEYSRKRQYICDRCKKKIKALTEVDIVALTSKQDAIEKRESRFAKAVERIKKQVEDFDSYKSSIKVASTRMDRYGSIPEAMAAIELLKNKYKIIPQQKIGNTRVDFCLPDNKLVIEIDGSLYHTDMNKEIRRDANIKYCLGQDWTILHYPADKVSRNIKGFSERIHELTDNIPQADS